MLRLSVALEAHPHVLDSARTRQPLPRGDVMQTLRWVVNRRIMLLVLLALDTGCATAPEPPLPPPMVMKAEDFKRLAGLWTGTLYVQEANPVTIQGRIYDNGTFSISRLGLMAVPVP